MIDEAEIKKLDIKHDDTLIITAQRWLTPEEKYRASEIMARWSEKSGYIKVIILDGGTTHEVKSP